MVKSENIFQICFYNIIAPFETGHLTNKYDDLFHFTYSTTGLLLKMPDHSFYVSFLADRVEAFM